MHTTPDSLQSADRLGVVFTVFTSLTTPTTRLHEIQPNPVQDLSFFLIGRKINIDGLYACFAN